MRIMTRAIVQISLVATRDAYKSSITRVHIIQRIKDADLTIMHALPRRPLIPERALILKRTGMQVFLNSNCFTHLNSESMIKPQPITHYHFESVQDARMS